MKGIESPVVIGTSSLHKTLLNSYNADVIWSSRFEGHHPIKICYNKRVRIEYLTLSIALGLAYLIYTYILLVTLYVLFNFSIPQGIQFESEILYPKCR